MINKVKWGFATMTALTLMFSQGAGAVTQAFAADGTTAQTQTATTTSGTSTQVPTSTTTSGTSTNSGSAINPTSGATTGSDTQQVKAGILPDNFFYFVKMMIEKIDLAFASNDKEKAKLLSNYAAERIAEANALIKKGETDKAAETLQQAIDQQKQALSLSNPTSTSASTSTDASGATAAAPTSGNATTTTSATTDSTNATSGDSASTPATSGQTATTATTSNQGSAVNTTSGTTTT
ncbi:MAG TPA: DUF5667 domain-containing protein, partial [Sporolactobacillaceae bacterium]|nr:DUF5667 domain-containing protein [Sporolactobacillaceae bacterium]